MAKRITPRNYGSRPSMKSIISLLLILAFTASFARAEERTFFFRTEAEMDATAKELRRALNAWANASDGPTDNWAPLEIPTTGRVELGGGLMLVVVETRSEKSDTIPVNFVRLMLVSGDDSVTGVLREGETLTLAPLQIQGVRIASATRTTSTLLVKHVDPVSQLMDAKPLGPATARIEGDTTVLRLTVASSDEREMQFVQRFMDEMKKGASAKKSAKAAFAAVPPMQRRSAPAESERFAPKSATMESGSYGGLPGSIMVTVSSVTGEESAIRELTSAIAYRSDGRTESPSVGASSGPGGTDVSVGNRGDKFSGKLHALEAARRVDISNTSMSLVELGGSSRMAIQGNGVTYDIIINTSASGRSAVLLDIDLIERNAGSGSSRRQRARVTDGTTVQLAGFTSSRTESQSSGVPILSGIPIVGGAFENSRSTSDNFSNAIFATVEFQ